jgi:hypothetical protein
MHARAKSLTGKNETLNNMIDSIDADTLVGLNTIENNRELIWRRILEKKGKKGSFCKQILPNINILSTETDKNHTGNTTYDSLINSQPYPSISLVNQSLDQNLKEVDYVITSQY